MRKIIANFFILLPFVLFTIITKGQGVSINNTGNAPYAGVILDLSNNNINGTVGCQAPFVSLTNATTLAPPITGGTSAQLGGLIVYNINPSVAGGLSGPGLYYWNATLSSWVYFVTGIASGSGTSNYIARWITPNILGTGVAQDNGTGVSISSTALAPLSKLDVNGGVSVGAAYAGTVAAPANGMIISGPSGIGNTAPNSTVAILDLTNAGNKGLMLPSMTTANLPAAPVDGLVVYNTTVNCVEFSSGGKWYRMLFEY